jgi:tetratricopeptide (TPR) repeat protein
MKNEKLASAKQFEKQGNQKYYAHKYKEAIDFYMMAKSIYEELGDTKELLRLQTRLQECEECNRRYEDGQNYEKQGDERANAKKFKKALSLYNMARQIYSDLKMNDEVKRLDQKIAETEEKRKWYNPFD